MDTLIIIPHASVQHHHRHHNISLSYLYVTQRNTVLTVQILAGNDRERYKNYFSRCNSPESVSVVILPRVVDIDLPMAKFNVAR